jgi:peptidoglycan/xylan/chitin deacetylase (PgdA/CDA1 family)
VSHRLTILAWHNVEATWCYPAAAGTGVRGLGRQLQWLKRVANVVPLERALGDLNAGRPLPPRAVALSFDDGYRDTLDLAVPILERLRLPATFFLVPGLLSGEVSAWWEHLGWAFANAGAATVRFGDRDLPVRGAEGRRSYELLSDRLRELDRSQRDRATQELVERLRPSGQARERELFMDWQAAKELVERGFEVGSHSNYHAVLSRERAAEQVRDLATARERLEGGLGVPVRLLAYPSGQASEYDRDTVRAAELAGHTHAFTTDAGWNTRATPRLEEHRVVLEPYRGFTSQGIRRVVARLSRTAQPAEPPSSR